MRASLLLALALLLALGGCELAGNPVPYPVESDWMPYQGAVDRTETKLAYVPARNGERFVRTLVPRLAPRELHHRDTVVAPGGAVAFVKVRPIWGRAVSPRVVQLVTEFQLESGAFLRRSWVVPANRPEWYGVFALPGAPLGARTALAP